LGCKIEDIKKTKIFEKLKENYISKSKFSDF